MLVFLYSAVHKTVQLLFCNNFGSCGPMVKKIVSLSYTHKQRKCRMNATTSPQSWCRTTLQKLNVQLHRSSCMRY